jgi:hypothetical protein
MDSLSFAHSLSLLDNLMLRERPCQSLTEYVHFMRPTFEDYNETCEMIDCSAAIHPHNMALLMLRAIFNTGNFGHAKPCAISAFNTNYLPSADEAMANIIHLAHNMYKELHDPAMTAPDGHAPPIFAFVAARRDSHNGRGHSHRGGRGGRGLVDCLTSAAHVAV